MAFEPGAPLYRFLDTDGDGTGTIDAIGDYSSVSEEFYCEAGADEVYRIARLLVYVRDTFIIADNYGNITGGLANGLDVEVDRAGAPDLDLLGGTPIKTSSDWGRHCFDVEALQWGSGNEFLVVRWTFEKSGAPLILQPGERLIVRGNDDLTGLISHTFLIQGMIQS